MNKYEKTASSFVDLLNDELKKIHEEKGERPAMVSKNAFQTLQVYSLIMLLTNGHEDPEYASRIDMVLGGVSDIMSAFLADMSIGLTNEQINETMAFADRMYSTQQSMIQRVDSVVQ